MKWEEWLETVRADDRAVTECRWIFLSLSPYGAIFVIRKLQSFPFSFHGSISRALSLLAARCSFARSIALSFPLSSAEWSFRSQSTFRSPLTHPPTPSSLPPRFISPKALFIFSPDLTGFLYCFSFFVLRAVFICLCLLSESSIGPFSHPVFCLLFSSLCLPLLLLLLLFLRFHFLHQRFLAFSSRRSFQWTKGSATPTKHENWSPSLLSLGQFLRLYFLLKLTHYICN